MRIGFVPLIDAAPIIAAQERGFFADEGLAVSRRYAETAGGLGGATMTALVRAVLRGCMWCAETVAGGNTRALAEMLARPEYLAQPGDVLLESLTIDRRFGPSRVQERVRPTDWVVRSFSPERTGGTFPNKMHAVWMMREMMRWGQLHARADVVDIAGRCSDAAAYRKAATTLGVGCPSEDFVAMELRGGRVLTLEDVARGTIQHTTSIGMKTERRVPARVA